MGKKWIQKALKNHKKGSFSRQLGIPEEENIPMALIEAIISAKAGETITNPTNKGFKRIKVTRLLERRAILSQNLKRINK